jgi:hypothetical protein
MQGRLPFDFLQGKSEGRDGKKLESAAHARSLRQHDELETWLKASDAYRELLLRVCAACAFQLLQLTLARLC